MWINSMDEIDATGEHMKNLKSELWERLFRLTSANKHNPNCIDGRDSDNARPSIPGGKFGALGVVFAAIDSMIGADYDREQITKIVKQYFGGKLWGHSDTHKQSNQPGHECDGCGHVYRLLHEGTERYNLQSESVQSLVEQIISTENTEIDVLEGTHQERSVIIVNAPGYGKDLVEENDRILYIMLLIVLIYTNKCLENSLMY